MLTFNRAAETITGMPRPTRSAQPIAEVLQLPGEFRELFGRRERPRRGCRGVEFGFHRATAGTIELGHDQRAADHAARRERLPVHVPGRDRAQKQEREARVQQRLAAVGEMAAGIAHEIRNPLASMAGSIQILRTSCR